MTQPTAHIDLLFKTNGPKFLGICAAALSRRPVPNLDAGDVLSMVYLKARNGGHLDNADTPTDLARVKVMARSVVTDERRRQRATVDPSAAPEPVYGGLSPLDALLMRERDQGVRRALAQLEDRHQAAIDEADFKDRSYLEIAAAWGEPKGTVCSKVYRARLAFKTVYTATLSD